MIQFSDDMKNSQQNILYTCGNALLLARLESAYSLIQGARSIWEQDLGTFMISRPI